MQWSVALHYFAVLYWYFVLHSCVAALTHVDLPRLSPPLPGRPGPPPVPLTQGRADSAQARVDSSAKSVFLILVSHAEVTVTGKPEGHQPATRQATQHRGQGSTVGKQRKEVRASTKNFMRWNTSPYSSLKM